MCNMCKGGLVQPTVAYNFRVNYIPEGMNTEMICPNIFTQNVQSCELDLFNKKVYLRVRDPQDGSMMLFSTFISSARGKGHLDIDAISNEDINYKTVFFDLSLDNYISTFSYEYNDALMHNITLNFKRYTVTDFRFPFLPTIPAVQSV